MVTTFAIIAASCSLAAILFLVAYIHLSITTIAMGTNDSHTTILNTFPSELMQSKKSRLIMIASIMATAFSFLGFSFFFAAMFSSSLSSTNGTFSIKSATYFAMAITLINCITMFLTTYIGYNKSVRIPLAMNVVFIASTFCIGVVMPLICNPEAQQYSIYTLDQVVGWIGFAFGMIGALPMMNPKLNEWDRLEKTEVNGATIYVRPKINHLSTYMWGCMILVGLFHLLLIINSILMIV